MGTPRREIKSRDTAWAKALATFIATKTNITPNDISVFSGVCGLFAFIGYCGYIGPQVPEKYYFILIEFIKSIRNCLYSLSGI